MSYIKINDTKVYKLAFQLAMEIFEVSKRFPKEERYSLTDQVRRSSRSVCACLAEAHRKRLYPAHFVSKISDADMENSETQTWLEFALACKCLPEEEHKLLLNLSEQVGSLLHHMIGNPEKYK
jgi:four helix bundle protein